MVISSTLLPTEFGSFKVCYHQYNRDFCVSLSCGQINESNCFVRLHSSCLFSESFSSIDCDCKLQLTRSLEIIGKARKGVVIYLYQEGRGYGLANKIKAMEVERTKKIDTVEAFKYLHFNLDPRDYTVAIKALKDLAINPKIRLITNNPRKITQLRKAGFIVVSNVKISYPINSRVRQYLKVKKLKLGHLIPKELIQN